MTRARLALGLAFGASVLVSRGALAQTQSPPQAPAQPARAAAAPRRAPARGPTAPHPSAPSPAPAAPAQPAAPPAAPQPTTPPAPAQPVAATSAAPAPVVPPAQPPPGQPVYVDQYGRPIVYVDQYGRPVQPPAQPPPGYVPAQPPPGYAQQPVYVDQYGRPIQQPPPNQLPPGYVEGTPTPAHREPANLRGTIGLHALFTVYQGSQYRTASHAWGYDAFGNAVGASLDGGYHIHRAFLLGARLALSAADGGQATFDGSHISLLTFDFNAIARVGYPIHLGSGDWIFYPGFQLEVGAMYAGTTLRMQTASAVVPRVAGELFMGFMGKHVGLSFRLGYQYATWGNAGSSGEDLALGGLLVGLGLEFRL